VASYADVFFEGIMVAPTIIGICGKAGSGKSSVGRHLIEKYGAQRVSFAEPLKRMAMDIWGFSEEQVFGEADVKETIDPRWDITPRQAMQKLGAAARDHMGDDIWIMTAIDHIDGPGLWIIDDVRYCNEAKMLSQLGTVLRLHCSDSISTDTGEHPSEAEVDLIPANQVIDIYSNRVAGLEHLFGLVDIVVDEILVRR
jgi:hypothetical protein